MPDAVDRIEAALLTLVRRANDPRGSREMYLEAGVDIERSGAQMLARIDDLEPVRLGDLAEAVGVETSTASRQVARLIDDGFVERHSDPDDGRAQVHTLTEHGRSARKLLRAASQARLEDRMADFSPGERTRFAELLERFVGD